MSKGTHIAGKRTLAAIVCGLALLAGGCGSDKEGKQLPRSSVTALNTSLDSIQRRVELGDGACRDVVKGSDTDVANVQAKIDALPSDVDKDVRDALQKSFDNLFRLVTDKCGNTQTETNTTPTETVPTVTQTVPTVTETVPTETTPTQTTTTPAPGEKKPKKDKGNSGGEAAPGGG